jgi:hypothetical protein
MKYYGPIMGHLTEFVVLLLGLTFLGHWLDAKTGNGSRYIFVGVAVGFGVGIWRLSTSLKKIVDLTDKEYSSDQKNEENKKD